MSRAFLICKFQELATKTIGTQATADAAENIRDLWAKNSKDHDNNNCNQNENQCILN